MAKPFKKVFDKETLSDLLIAVIDREEFLPSKMGELRRTVITSAKPDVAGHTVMIKGESFGTGAVYNKKKLVPNAIYPLNIKFYNVSFSDKKNNQHTIKVNLGHGDFIWQEPLRKGRHPVEVRCTCFVGDTLIQLASGRSVKIKDLVGEEEFFVYSFDTGTHKRVIGKGHSARITGKNRQVVKVTFDNGNSIICTPDHKFLLSNGEYKEVQSIKPDESLMATYRRLSDKTNNTKRSLIGYEQIFDRGVWVYTHWLSDLWNHFKVLIKTGEVKNHKIIKIENAGCQDVYCLTVDKYHNFSVDVDNGIDCSSGVIVSNCKDEYFRWWKWNDLAKSHFGRKFPKYIRKTSTWPEVNPKKLEGFCKHLFSLVLKLEKEGLLKK